MLKKLGRSGGPEEDRTPDLLIAKVAAVRRINDLRRCINVENSRILATEGTFRAQSPKGLNRAAATGNHGDSYTKGVAR